MIKQSKQTLNNNMSFLGNHGNAGWWPHTNLAQHFCEFNQELYQDFLFDTFGINCPETVKKSVIKRRSEYLAGRYCAKKALAKIQCFPTDIAIGKQREPVWPTGVIGTISHTTGLATAIVTKDPEVLGLGIDVEVTVDHDTMDKIGKHILPLEHFALLNQEGLKINEVFTLMFSVKESFYKAAYPRVQRYFDFGAVNVLSFDQKQKKITFRLTENLCEGLTIGQEFEGYYYQFSEEIWATMVCLT